MNLGTERHISSCLLTATIFFSFYLQDLHYGFHYSYAKISLDRLFHRLYTSHSIDDLFYKEVPCRV